MNHPRSLRPSPLDADEEEWQIFQLTLELLSDRDKRKALRFLQESLGLVTVCELNISEVEPDGIEGRPHRRQ